MLFWIVPTRCIKIPLLQKFPANWTNYFFSIHLFNKRWFSQNYTKCVSYGVFPMGRRQAGWDLIPLMSFNQQTLELIKEHPESTISVHNINPWGNPRRMLHSFRQEKCRQGRNRWDWQMIHHCPMFIESPLLDSTSAENGKLQDCPEDDQC